MALKLSAEGIAQETTCKCYAVGMPQCGYGAYCTCAPKGALASGYSAGYITKNAPCRAGHATVPAAVTPLKSTGVETIEAADPERARALQKMGFKRSSTWYRHRLLEGKN